MTLSPGPLPPEEEAVGSLASRPAGSRGSGRACRWERLVGVATLAHGELKRLQVRGREVVVLNHEGNYFALDGHCTHKPEALLAEGILYDTAVMCPWHGFRYDVQTGRNVHPGTAPPVACIPVRVEGPDLWLDLG